MVDARLHDLAIEAERALLSPTVRGDAAALERMLDERFTEIGQSGRLYTRIAIIAALVAERARGEAEADAQRVGAARAKASGAESANGVVRAEPATRHMTDVRIETLAPDTLLLTYLLQFDGRWSRRSSIWRVSSNEHDRDVMRLLFHQGTAVNPT